MAHFRTYVVLTGSVCPVLQVEGRECVNGRGGGHL